MLSAPDIDRVFDRLWEKVVRTCPHCRGSGSTVVDDGEDVRSIRCSCYQSIRVSIGKIEANIPKEFWGADGVRTDAHDFIEVYGIRSALKSGSSIIFYGDLGRGKTTSACTILIRAISAGHSAGYITAPDYIEATLSSDREVIDRRNSIVGSQFLVIDEFGNEYRKTGSEYGKKKLEELIRSRRSQLLPTIICVNFENAAKFKAAGGDVVWSLLGGRTKSFQFSGEDYRRGR